MTVTGYASAYMEADIVANMGTILPMMGNYTRNTADTCNSIAKGLENPDIAGNVICVVAASPQEAGTHSLNRYPSPYGRLCALWHRPPFFLNISKGYGDKRSIARNGAVGIEAFDRGNGIALSGVQDPCKKDQGPSGCDSPSYSFYRFWHLRRLRPLQPVGTRLLNRVRRVMLLGQRILFYPARPIRTAAINQSRASGVQSCLFRSLVQRALVGFSHAGGLCGTPGRGI